MTRKTLDSLVDGMLFSIGSNLEKWEHYGLEIQYGHNVIPRFEF